MFVLPSGYDMTFCSRLKAEQPHTDYPKNRS